MTPSPSDIVAARKERGLTQTAAAALLGRSLSAWQRWEYGTRTMPTGLWELFLLKTRKLKK